MNVAIFFSFSSWIETKCPLIKLNAEHISRLSIRTLYRRMELGSATVNDGQVLWNRGYIPLLSTVVRSIHDCKVGRGDKNGQPQNAAGSRF